MRKWRNQKANSALKIKIGNKQSHKYTKYNENKWAAISQKVVTQKPKPN